MALFRIRRPVRLLPGPRLSLSQAAPRPSSGLRGPHATFDRRAHRAPAEARTGNGFSNENEQRMSDPHKQQTSAVSLLIACLLYTSDAADERSSVDLGGRRI